MYLRGNFEQMINEGKAPRDTNLATLAMGKPLNMQRVMVSPGLICPPEVAAQSVIEIMTPMAYEKPTVCRDPIPFCDVIVPTIYAAVDPRPE
ncbi:hypothetical protein M404DRAFT_991304 [Pisolithus tinctorius Marx 270]|uniref:Uncharacterized protein n=1 Tax=Pisolithus tinctorius Marx 270 TaxID=870435 RepID=A0A0C3PK19_PISTI|nr:hypothetical protein M404DRAFT_991304 [Pisolithus tinctorius Marx 270]